MDVQRYLADETVQACPPSVAYRLRKFARRNKVALVTTTLIAAALVLGTVVSMWQAFRATQAEGLAQERLQAETNARTEADEQRTAAVKQETRAKAQEARAKEEERTARRHLYAAHINLAQQAWESGDAGRVLELLEGQRPLPAREDLRGFEWYYLWRLCHEGLLTTLRGRRQGAVRVAFSPDNSILASASPADGIVKLWNLNTGRARVAIRAQMISALSFSPDGSMLAFGGYDGSLRLCDVATGLEHANLSGHSGNIRAIAFTPDGKTLASNGQDRVIGIWDLSTGQKRTSLSLNSVPGWNRGLALSPNGKLLAAAYDNHTVKLWEVATGKERMTLKNMQVLSVAFSPDGKTLATGSGNDFADDGIPTIKLWDLNSGKETATIRGPTGWVLSLVFSPDGKSLAWATGSRIAVWMDVETKNQLALPHMGAVGCVAFSPDGKKFVTGSEDASVKVWDASVLRDKSVGQERDIIRHADAVRAVAISPDGKTLATSWEKASTIKLWSLDTCQEVAALEEPKGVATSPNAMAFSPDGKTLAYATMQVVRLWRRQTANWEKGPTLTGPAHPQWINCLAFSPDGRMLAAGISRWPVQGECEIRVWDTLGLIDWRLAWRP
jgi:WD40 repeat protein